MEVNMTKMMITSEKNRKIEREVSLEVQQREFNSDLSNSGNRQSRRVSTHEIKLLIL